MTAAPDLFGIAPVRAKRAPAAEPAQPMAAWKANGAHRCAVVSCGADASFGFQCVSGDHATGAWFCFRHKHFADERGLR